MAETFRDKHRQNHCHSSAAVPMTTLVKPSWIHRSRRAGASPWGPRGPAREDIRWWSGEPQMNGFSQSLYPFTTCRKIQKYQRLRRPHHQMKFSRSLTQRPQCMLKMPLTKVHHHHRTPTHLTTGRGGRRTRRL